MRWLEFLRQRKISNGFRSAGRLAVEALETRCLLNATLTSAINAVAIAQGQTPASIDLSQHFNDPLVPGTLVKILTPNGTIKVALTDATTPKTVANFLSYITNGEYQGTIIHRLAANFVIQGGGYDKSGTHITQAAAIQSEAGASNVAGTIAMALSTGPNSGTSEWFINLANNSSSLDGSGNGGPFTVFGNVVYDGMVTVNTIGALPVIDGRSLNQAIDVTLPVENASNGTAASNLVSTDYQVSPALTYTATSDDPNVVVPTITGSSLSLALGTGTGNTQVHVTATDAGGNTATATFAVGVGLQTVTVGSKGVQLLRFRDAGGTLGNIALTGGKGTATVTLVGANLTQTPGRNGVVTVEGITNSVSVATAGTSPTSVLTIIGQGGNGIVHLTGLTTDAAIALLNAPRASINGDITESGAIKKMVVGSISNSTVTIGAGTSVDMNVGVMNNVAISSFIALNQLKVDTWSGTASISATSLNDIEIARSFGGNINASRIGKFKAGSISGGNWGVAGDVKSFQTKSIAGLNATFTTLGNLRVQDAVSGSTIKTSGNIGSITAGSFTSTNLYAGTANLTSGLPASASEFTATDKIGSVKVNRFVNSDIVAQRTDSLALGSVQVANSGTAFGVATQRIKRFSLSVGKAHVNLSNVTTTDKVTNAFSKAKITAQDLAVKIL